MPKAVERKIAKSLAKSHPDWSKEKRMSVMYAIMNKQGLLNNRNKKK